MEDFMSSAKGFLKDLLRTMALGAVADTVRTKIVPKAKKVAIKFLDKVEEKSTRQSFEQIVQDSEKQKDEQPPTTET